MKAKPSVTKYHDTSSSPDVFSMFLNYIGAYVYSQKMGETCNVWDTDGTLKNTLRMNPQVKLLKERPELEPLSLSEYKNITSSMKFKDVQKFASSLMVYDNDLNQSVVQYLKKAGINGLFDLAIHIMKDPAGPDIALMKKYVSLIRAYQVKTKKTNLNIFVMSDNYTTVTQFQTYCDSTWKISSLSKNPVKNNSEEFIKAFAEIQVMTAVPALILDFQRPVDRFIYLMQRNPKLDYFTELNSMEWFLLE
jgi:hypothetical protein